MAASAAAARRVQCCSSGGLGLVAPSMGLASSSTGYFFFFIYQGGQGNASVNASLTVTFGWRRLACLPQKIIFARLEKDFYSSG